jgi:hypothetical protein
MEPRTTFPLDILLYIIDLLADDGDMKSLQILSQACKSMVPLCRKYLFSSLHLRTELSSKCFSNLLSRNPDIACYVRNLNYGVYNPIQVIDHDLNILDSDLNFLDTLKNILDTLKKHSSLHLIKLSPSEFNWIHIHESIRSSLLSLIQLPTVTHLILSINGFPAITLSGCSNLVDLQIEARLAPPQVNQIISRSKIPTPISLYINELSSFATYLNSANGGPIVDFSHLQKAKFVVTSRRGFFSVNELIKEATRLEYFSILYSE